MTIVYDLNIFCFIIIGSKMGHHIRHGNHHFIEPGSKYVNCSVAYMSQCMSLSKCKMSCQSMGAVRY